MEDGASSVRKLASSVECEERLDFARAVVLGVVSAYWKALEAVSGRGWPLRELPSEFGLASVPEEAAEQAERIGIAAAGLDVLDAGYTIGVLYTGLMPDRFRAQLGAYYTPPALCERLLDMATEAGVDWCSARVLDPACGGGAFLAPVARRMADSLKCSGARVALESVQRRLRGFERDPFAAWMSQVFLDAALADLCGEAGVGLRSVVRVCNSLEQTPAGEGFDLVVGNPPLRAHHAVAGVAGEVPPQPVRACEPLRRVHRPGAAVHSAGRRHRLRDPDELPVWRVFQGAARSSWPGSAAGEHRLHGRAQRRLCRCAAGNAVGGVSTRWRPGRRKGPLHLGAAGRLNRKDGRGRVHPA